MKHILLSLLFAAFVTGCGNTGAKNPGAGGVVATNSKYPYAKPVPDKPGFVYSPYTDELVHINVEGFKRGTQVKDPFANKIFLVP